MMTTSLELSFDSKPDQFCSMLLKSVGEHTTEKTQTLEEFLARLEEERVKIDAFKRELPLCMQLLNNAMEASRQQLHSQKMNQGSSSIPVLEEFIPMKNTTNSCEAHNADNIAATDKANWMTSAQLWNQENPETITNQETDIKLGLNGKQMINGGEGVFFPFSSKDRNLSFPDLALASSHKHEVEDHMNNNNNDSLEKRENNSCKNGNSSVIEKDQQQFGGLANTSSSQTQRKARRCWSPDLHRRFVNALHMLGGSQVATPKQIRELMKVDGLTNDEVKSHLQKYRLHTRRPSPSPQTALTAGPQVVVLGGIWLPPEYAAAAAQGGAQAAAYAAATHHMSHPYSSGGPSMPQEMYQTIAPPQPQQNHHMHQHIQAYNRALLEKRDSFSGSDIPRGTGDPSESMDDDKSESGSWKADSGSENGGERKRVDGEESNASTVVSLKF